MIILNKRTITASILTIFSLFLTNKFWLVNSSFKNFVIEVFIIILVLSFLLFYKLADYIADFKTLQGKSRLDIFFLIIFFCLLFIPVLHIDNRDKSIEENRMLAVYKPLFKNGKINYSYGKDFERWFNDRFFLRDILISIYNYSLKINKNINTEKVIEGKDGWLFYKTNQKMLTPYHLKKIDNYLKAVNDYCETNNKKFYFVIVPDKQLIYSEYFNENIKINNDYTIAHQLVEYIGKNSNVKVIYPKKTLLNNKKNKLTYYKLDSHWTPLGAYYAYKEVMKKIKEDYGNTEIYKVEKYKQINDSFDLNELLPKSLKIKSQYLYSVPDIYNKVAVCYHIDENKKIMQCRNDNKKLKITIYKDSFGNALIDYFAESFGLVTVYRQKNIKYSTIKDSDIIILETVERHISQLPGNMIEMDM